MVSTRKRSYSSSNDSGYASEATEPILKRPKNAVAASNKRKRNVSNITKNDEMGVTVGLISKRPKIDESKNNHEASTPSSSSATTISTETPIITEMTTTTSPATTSSLTTPTTTVSSIISTTSKRTPRITSTTSSSSTTTTTINEEEQLSPTQPKKSKSKCIQKNSFIIIEENKFKNQNIRKSLKDECENYLPEFYSSNNCSENLEMHIECPKECQKNGICKNHFISNKSGLKENVIELFHTEKKGYGMKTSVEIPKGTYIGNYCGEVIDEIEKERRCRKKNKKNSNAFYMMKLENYFIDAEFYGSKMRFLNHSCDPNCETKVYIASDGLPNVCIFAAKNIPAGEELTFNYSPDKNHQNEQEFKCYCGAENCDGTFFA